MGRPGRPKKDKEDVRSIVLTVRLKEDETALLEEVEDLATRKNAGIELQRSKIIQRALVLGFEALKKQYQKT